MTRRLIAVQHQHKRPGMTMHMDNLTLISKKPGKEGFAVSEIKQDVSVAVNYESLRPSGIAAQVCQVGE
uniref:NOI n=1 Tax=Solanum tuberosum TaxID=4113 RepID=M1AY77_SOLTU